MNSLVFFLSFFLSPAKCKTIQWNNLNATEKKTCGKKIMRIHQDYDCSV